MGATLLEKVQPQAAIREEIRAHESGTLEAWHVTEGEEVNLLTPLCDTEWNAYTAPAAGVVRIVAAVGTVVDSGDILCYVEGASPTKPKQRIMANRGEPTPLSSPSRRSESKVEVSSKGTRSHQPENNDVEVKVEELTIEPTHIAPPRPNKRKEHKRTKNRTYSVGAHQERALARLAAELKLDDSSPTVNESELVRVAIEMLLELPRPALLAMIRSNKRHEAKEKFGTGRPRPGKTLE